MCPCLQSPHRKPCLLCTKQHTATATGPVNVNQRKKNEPVPLPQSGLLSRVLPSSSTGFLRLPPFLSSPAENVSRLPPKILMRKKKIANTFRVLLLNLSKSSTLPLSSAVACAFSAASLFSLRAAILQAFNYLRQRVANTSPAFKSGGFPSKTQAGLIPFSSIPIVRFSKPFR